MEFWILGALQVVSDGVVLSLGGVKPRVVLAVLLLHANEPVSAERLALALWGEEAPAGAIKTVQMHVSRLRKALGDAEILQTTPAGYRLRVRPGELDVERFERLAGDGQRALAAGRAEHAAAVLAEALDVWRGPALADLAFEPFAQPEIARLEERRLSVLEARVDADLATGGHTELVGELQRLVGTHPARERFAEQLMLALYRCGRQADALEAYKAARRALVDAFGVEPGPALLGLHEAILHQSASLQTRPGADLPPELHAATATALYGRDRELARLGERWRSARAGAGTLVTIIGPRGIGKTRLAADLGVQAQRDGATVLYAAGSGPAEAILASLPTIGGPTRLTLLVLDDADKAGVDVLAGVQDLTRVLPTRPILVLATGQDAQALACLGDDVLRLEALDEQAVRAIAIGYAPSRAGADVPVEWLIDGSGGVPARVHEVARQWARRDAARRVGTRAERAASSRAELRSIEAELAGDVIELQAASDRGAPYGADKAPVVCPFKGLASFDVADAPYFFGRERLVAQLVARLVGAPLLGVVGPSGSGKSSILRAGLLPALASGVVPSSEHWMQRIIRPGQHPLNELREAMVTTSSDQRIVLAIDQFEETFTLCRDSGERASFIAELTAAATDRGGRCVVVLAIRADHYGRCAAYPLLSGLLASNHVLVGSMRRDELRQAIEGPAARAGLRIEPDLVQALVDDVADEPGALPLLSTALLELWQRRDGRRLRHAAYQQAGGVRGAVGRLAEDAYNQLDGPQQTLVRSVLLRLVEEGASATVERRRVPLVELDSEEDSDTGQVITLLTDRRLLTVSAGTVEVAHEALLREWPRLRDWIEEEREGLRIHRRLTAAAHEWQRLDHDTDVLYRGNRLTEAADWQAGRGPPLNALEREFLQAGHTRSLGEQAARRNRARLAFAGLAVALAAITVVALVALYQGRQAARERDLATSRALAANAINLLGADPGLSLALAQRAVQTGPTAQADSALRQAVRAFRDLAVLRVAHGRVVAAHLSPDGHRAVIASYDNAVGARDVDALEDVRVWNLDNGRVLMRARVGLGMVNGFDVRGRWLASARTDGAVTLTDVATGRPRIVISRPGTPADSVVLSQDARYVASGFSDGKVRIAKTDGTGQIRVLPGGHRGSVFALAFSDDGRRLASISRGGLVRIWNLSGGRAPLVVRGGPNPMVSVSISPDGRQVMAASDDGRIDFWSTVDGRRRGQVPAGEQVLDAARFSPDGRRVVAARGDGTVEIIDAATQRVTATLRGHSDDVIDATFSARGDRVFSAGADGTIRTWDPGRTLVMRAQVSATSFSPDGKHIVGEGIDGTVRIWNASSGTLESRLRGANSPGRARFSGDGRHIISSSFEGTAVRIWSVAGGTLEHVFHNHRGLWHGADVAAMDARGKRVVTAYYDGHIIIRSFTGAPPLVLTSAGKSIYDVAFSPDDRRLISAGADGTVRLWDPTRASGAIVVLRGHRGAVNSAQFSPDGQHLVSAGSDGTVRVWAASGRPEAVLRGHDGPVQSAAFNATGDRVVSAGVDGTVRVWDSRAGDPLLIVHTHHGWAGSAAFSPTGSDVVSAGEDGIIWLSACEACGPLHDVLQLARMRVQRPLSATERQRYLNTP